MSAYEVFGTVPAASGLFDAYAYLRDEKAANTAGGAATTGSWQTRTLNTEVSDEEGMVSLSSNAFTLQAGSYLIYARSPFFRTQGERIKLRNTTDSTDAGFSMSTGSVTTVNAEGTVITPLVARVVISSAKVFEIQYRVVANDGGNTNCLGYPSNFAAEVYTEVEILREGTGSGGGGDSSTLTRAVTQTGHGLVVGDWVRLNNGNYVVAQANSVANAEVVGVVTEVSNANNFVLASGGYVQGLTGLTAGVVYYLSGSSAGDITATEPTTNGHVSKPLLIADTASSGWMFNMRGAVVVVPSGRFLIQETTVGVGGLATIDFSSIPATYRHLEIEMYLQAEAATAQFVGIKFNNDSGTNYYTEFMSAAGSTMAAGKTEAQTSGRVGAIGDTGEAQGTFISVRIPYYRDTLTPGRRISKSDYATYYDSESRTGIFMTLWTGVAAINQITLLVEGGTDFKEGGIVTLYGISP